MLHFLGSLLARSGVKWAGTNQQEPAMLKKLLIAAAAVLVSAPALADGGRWDHRPQWKHWKHHPHASRVVVVPRVYYAPAPRVYYAPPPAPVYYAPPPVVYPAPVPHSGVSIRLHFPL
jgi:hypothetical protein